MRKENIKIGEININKSHKSFFTIVDEIIIPPLIKSSYRDYYILDKISMNKPYKNKDDIKRKLDIDEEIIEELKKHNLI